MIISAHTSIYIRLCLSAGSLKIEYFTSPTVVWHMIYNCTTWQHATYLDFKTPFAYFWIIYFYLFLIKHYENFLLQLFQKTLFYYTCQSGTAYGNINDNQLLLQKRKHKENYKAKKFESINILTYKYSIHT